jgi:molecular chaperone DnaK (HSP70)
MFVDFGHSKLSLYVIKFTKNYQKVVFQSHLRQVGCRNLDEQMLAFYSDLFENSNPNLEISVKESRKATIKLLENIEKQRKILSGNSEYDFNIDCLLE